MTSKFDIDETVYVKGHISRIIVNSEKETTYVVDIESSEAGINNLLFAEEEVYAEEDVNRLPFVNRK